MDEPLTGLDVTSRWLIAAALDQEHKAGRTTIMTTHSFEDAARCDLVVLLATRLIAFGEPEEVLREHNLRAAYGGRVVRVGDTVTLDDPHHDHAH